MRICRAGSRNRVPAGRVPANLQAPGIGCLQACRHPAGTRQAPSRHPGSGAGCLQAPAGTQQAPGIGCRVPAGTRQAPSRHPGSAAGCLQAPAGSPAKAREAFCAESAEGSTKVQAPAVRKIDESRNRGPAEDCIFKVLRKEGKLLSSSHGHCRAAVRKINESLTRGPAEHGLQSCTKRRKDPLLLSCYRRPLCVPKDAAVLRCLRKERARQR